MAERISNFGYMALKPETTPGTAVIPDVFVPLYSEDVSTDPHHVEDNPIVGNKFARYQLIQGQRSHGGDFTVLAEPNTTAKLLDMLMNKVSTSGANPYTHSFAFNQTDPKSYTLDISTGNQVFRFMGAGLSKLSPTFEDNEMRFDCSASALKSFYSREIASVSTNVLTLTTTYDPTPTDGLVATDLLAIELPNGTVVNTTVTSITATTVTVASAGAAAAGDIIKLRPQTAAYALKTPFLWARTEYRFSTIDAATALNATQTRVEQGSEWSVMHNFEDDEGAKRSGAFDPAALVRAQADAEVKIKKFFDSAADLKAFMAKSKQALVIRHFSEVGYELRVTFNNVQIKEGAKPGLDSGSVLYAEMTFSPVYDNTDAQAVDIKVIDALATI